MKIIMKNLPIQGFILLYKVRTENLKSCSRNFFLPAQLAPVYPMLQVHVPVEVSQVPWLEQSSGQSWTL